MITEKLTGAEIIYDRIRNGTDLIKGDLLIPEQCFEIYIDGQRYQIIVEQIEE